MPYNEQAQDNELSLRKHKTYSQEYDDAIYAHAVQHGGIAIHLPRSAQRIGSGGLWHTKRCRRLRGNVLHLLQFVIFGRKPFLDL